MEEEYGALHENHI
jgi:hypothetical protein